jgi:hypothetical protein
MRPYLPASKCVKRFTVLTAILLLFLLPLKSQNVDFGKSYVNITKGQNGGTVENGDILEIRASFVVRNGTYDSCAFYDAIPTGTTFIPGSIRVLTNEGKIYKQFTDIYDGDAGWISGPFIRINLGFSGSNPASATRRGRVANTHKPSFYGSTCIMIASFQVVVTAATGANISIGAGSITYKSGNSPIQTHNFPTNTVRVYRNMAICSNTVGVNALGTEFNGTFGSGKPRNRGISSNVPTGYTYRTFTTNTPNDYSYGIANNTSTQTNYSTHNNWNKPDNSSPSHRVFSVWDIIGDHTGAANPYTGNPAADTIPNSNAGYMLVVNAAYRIDSAFQQTISGLCPNTYYEISGWMRNICSKCGCDSNGKGATNTSGPDYYIPTATGDSSGVYPNVTFEIDGVDYYSTGNILYTGEWVKKGFTYLTGPSQTGFTLKFFNNAPGGGGNDWALDDIAVATCSPNMKYSPSLSPIVCQGNAMTIYDTVRSYFDNYTYYKWQRSTDGGATWIDVTAPAGPATPYWNGSDWEFVNSYTIPPAHTQLTDSADKYRLVVATTATNLSNASCRFTDEGNIITMSVIECGIPLSTNLLSFSGRLNKDNSLNLYWSTDREMEILYFDIERSIDGVQFTKMTTLNGYGDKSAEVNMYSFLEQRIQQSSFYRIVMRNKDGKQIYSRTLQFIPVNVTLAINSVINPFKDNLQFEVVSDDTKRLSIDMIDMSGRVVRRMEELASRGINRYNIESTGSLAPGIYTLRVISDGFGIQKRVLKQ